MKQTLRLYVSLSLLAPHQVATLVLHMSFPFHCLIFTSQIETGFSGCARCAEGAYIQCQPQLWLSPSNTCRLSMKETLRFYFSLLLAPCRFPSIVFVHIPHWNRLFRVCSMCRRWIQRQLQRRWLSRVPRSPSHACRPPMKQTLRF